jgi:hypothetical protein
MNIENFLNSDGEIVQDDSSTIDDPVHSYIQGLAGGEALP